MLFKELGYLVIHSTKLEEWKRFATEVLGAVVDESPGGRGLRIRTDEWAFRLLVEKGERDALYSTAWLAPDEAAYTSIRSQIASTGTSVIAGEESGRSLRSVRDYFAFSDPAGNRHEVFWGRTHASVPFHSPAGLRRFVTGTLGMGHVVLLAGQAFDETVAFWSRLGAFGLSDILFIDPTEEQPQYRVHFYHASGRHHSVAYADSRVPSFGCHHVMLEVESIDDVGRALDRAIAANSRIACTLGRHTNDRMISFYVESPSGFLIEYGCDGLVKDWADHEVCNYIPKNVWGHVWQEWWQVTWRADQARTDTGDGVRNQ